MGRAMDLATEMEVAHKRAEGTVKWTVEKIEGHIGRWTIIATSDHIPSAWVRRHGH